MNIEDLTIGQVKILQTMFSNNSNNPTQKEIDHGLQIVVLDRGFIYVGETKTDGAFVIITNAKNIRRWGTSKGLGELAREGKKQNTILDNVGTVKAPYHSLQHMIPCEVSAWK